MLHRIQTEAVKSGLLQVPVHPFLCFTDDFRVFHIDIHTHQVVEISLFRIRVGTPFLAREAVNDILRLCALVPVRAREIRVIPGELAVFAGASGECELRPGKDLLLVADLFVPVFRVVGDSCDFLELVTAHPVIQNDIGEDVDPRVVKSLYCFLIFFLGPVLCADRVLLVELAQIIHVVDAVADVILFRCLVCRRKPDVRYAQFF